MIDAIILDKNKDVHLFRVYYHLMPNSDGFVLEIIPVEFDPIFQ